MAKDKKDAIRIAINAGIDMSMDPYSVDFCILLKELVEEGQVPMSRIDDAVRRILRVKYRLNLFDEPTRAGRVTSSSAPTSMPPLPLLPPKRPSSC